MSSELKIKENKDPQEFQQYQENFSKRKVNLNELMEKLNEEKKKDRNHNIFLSAAAISAVTVFGIILTL